MIPSKYYDAVRQADPNQDPSICRYRYWQWDIEGEGDRTLLRQIRCIRHSLGRRISRARLVTYYLLKVPEERKFIAAMIWGSEAGEFGRRDGRGPWRLRQMFANYEDAANLVQEVKLDTEENIARSYRLLQKSLPYCGPSFITKHLYFLGKSQDLERYPVIFDQRVANGIAKLRFGSSKISSIISATANTSAEGYLQYLDLVHRAAEKIECDADQVEYFLFTYGGKVTG